MDLIRQCNGISIPDPPGNDDVNNVETGDTFSLCNKQLQPADIGSSTCDNGKILDAHWEVDPFGGGNKLFEREDQYGDSPWACWYDSLVATKIVKEELVHVAMSF